jgi:hypothetical protein
MSKSAARSPRLWIPVCFFGLVLAVPIMCQFRRHTREPRTITDFVTQAESRLGLHAVAAAKSGKPASGVYFCREGGRRREELPQARERVFLSDWKGVVLITNVPTTDSDFRERLTEWGDAAAVVGGLVVWGDPVLVAEIVKMVYG